MFIKFWRLYQLLVVVLDINPATARSVRPNLYLVLHLVELLILIVGLLEILHLQLIACCWSTYTLTATDCNGCSSSATLLLTQLLPIPGCTDPTCIQL